MKHKKTKTNKKIKEEKQNKKENKEKIQKNKKTNIIEESKTKYIIEKYYFITLTILLTNLYYLYFIRINNITNKTFYFILTILYLTFLYSITKKQKKLTVTTSLLILLTNILISILNLITNIFEKSLTIKEYNYHITILFLSTTLIIIEYIISFTDKIKENKINT